MAEDTLQQDHIITVTDRRLRLHVTIIDITPDLQSIPDGIVQWFMIITTIGMTVFITDLEDISRRSIQVFISDFSQISRNRVTCCGRFLFNDKLRETLGTKEIHD